MTIELACKAGFTDRVRCSVRLDDHTLDKVLLDNSAQSIIVEMSKAAMPEGEVEWESGCEIGKLI